MTTIIARLHQHSNERPRDKNTLITNSENNTSAGGTIILLLVLLNAVILKVAFIHSEKLYLALWVTVPLLVLSIYETRKKRNGVSHGHPFTGFDEEG